MKQQNLKALVATGQARRVFGLTRQERREAVRDALLDHYDDDFKTIKNIEDLADDELRKLPIAGTVFGFMAETLKGLGARTNGTMGNLMGHLDLTQTQVHHVACWCAYGDLISGNEAAVNLQYADFHRVKR